MRKASLPVKNTLASRNGLVNSNSMQRITTATSNDVLPEILGAQKPNKTPVANKNSLKRPNIGLSNRLALATKKTNQTEDASISNKAAKLAAILDS